MRKLNASQKKALRDYFRRGAKSVDDIAYSDILRVENLNPHETFWQNANRYLMDLHVERTGSAWISRTA